MAGRPSAARGLHVMPMFVKQWQRGFAHSRPGSCTPSSGNGTRLDRRYVRQQNHSPEVEQPSGHPAPWRARLARKWPATVADRPMPTHGLQGPPPQPTQPGRDPARPPCAVRQRPAPSDPTPRNLKSCRCDELPASSASRGRRRSIYGRGWGSALRAAGTHTAGRPSGDVGVHGIASVREAVARRVSQFRGPGQLHSEQRNRHPYVRSSGSRTTRRR